MSILSEPLAIISKLLMRQITFPQAATQIVQLFEHVETNVAGQAVSDLKQVASNAVALAGTEVGPALAAATVAVETAVDALLKDTIGSAGVTLSPLVNAGIDQLANLLKGAIDAAIADAKAALAQPAT